MQVQLFNLYKLIHKCQELKDLFVCFFECTKVSTILGTRKLVDWLIRKVSVQRPTVVSRRVERSTNETVEKDDQQCCTLASGPAAATTPVPDLTPLQ